VEKLAATKGKNSRSVVVCNTINAWWLLEVAPSHPQAALEAATHQIRCYRIVGYVDTSILFLDSRSRGQEHLVAYLSRLWYKYFFGINYGKYMRVK